ncbi:MAG: arsenite methyltransferase [Planctomycetes bacterium]|nr:arsenite methyltransferase [Planctomycetota bacterium]
MSHFEEQVKNTVQKRYADIARRNSGTSCCEDTGSCCSEDAGQADSRSTRLGYSLSELKDLPSGADMGLGSGHPVAHASLEDGETVLDLGSGGGIDCFLAARQVGDTGRVLGVDMTPEMVEKATRNAQTGGFDNVEFISGDIENLPITDGAVDVVISNCVINLSPEKKTVYEETYRVLKPGGRMVISDIVASEEMPEEIKNNPNMLCGCVGGAAPMGKIKMWLTGIGFDDIAVEPDMNTRRDYEQWVPGAEGYVVSAIIRALKP